MNKDEPITWAIKDHGGKVVVEFSRQTRNVVMDPENARAIGEGIAKAAYAAQYGAAPEEGRNVISEQVMSKLMTRLTLVIRQMQDTNKAPAYIASSVLDVVMREVT